MTSVVFYKGMIMASGGVANLPRDTHVMYLRSMFALTQGDFGASPERIAGGVGVSTILLSRIPVTLVLVLGSALMSGILGVALGIIAAIRQNKLLDKIIMILTLFTSSMPLMFLGLILILIFSRNFGNLPFIGLTSPQHAILPIATLTVPAVAFIARTTRTAMLEALTMPHITAARARGLPERKILLSHAVSNMRIPVITAVSLRLAELFMGTVLVETVFSIPGLGRLLMGATSGRNIPLVMGSIIFMSLLFMFITLVVDILYIVVDPRTRKNFG